MREKSAKYQLLVTHCPLFGVLTLNLEIFSGCVQFVTFTSAVLYLFRVYYIYIVFFVNNLCNEMNLGTYNLFWENSQANIG